MENNSKGNDSPYADKHIGRYKSMLKKQARYYFDVEEFEGIIDYFLEKGKVKEAENALKYSFKLHPDSVSLKLKQAHILIDRDEIETAFNLLNQMKSIQSKEPEVYFLLGFIEVANSNIDNAEDHFIEYLRLGGTDDEVLSSIAFVYEQNGIFDKAIQYLNKAYSLNEKNKYVLYDLAYCWEQAGDLEKSAEFYEKYLEENPFSANGWYNYGVINNLLKRYKKAIEAYDFAIALKPGFSSAYFNKASVLANRGKCKEAIDVHKEFLKIEKRNIQSLTHLADCYRKISDLSNAMKFYKKALKVDKYYSDALYGVASVYYLKNDYLEGLNYIIRATKNNNKNFEYHYLSGLLFSNLGHVEKAEVCFLKSLKINPFSKKIWLSYADLFTKENDDRTMNILLEAEKIVPDNAEINYRLAAYFFDLNNIVLANKHLEKAITVDADLVHQFLDYCPNAMENSDVESLLERMT